MEQRVCDTGTVVGVDWLPKLSTQRSDLFSMEVPVATRFCQLHLEAQ